MLISNQFLHEISSRSKLKQQEQGTGPDYRTVKEGQEIVNHGYRRNIREHVITVTPSQHLDENSHVFSDVPSVAMNDNFLTLLHTDTQIHEQ